MEAGVTATGSFRDRPAIILRSKSHPIQSKQTFQIMDVLLGELTPDQRSLSPLKVEEQLRKKVETFESQELAAVQKKHQKEIATLQEKYGKKVPQDKLGKWSEAFNKVMDAQGKEMDQVHEQVKALRVPRARNHGSVTITGQDGHDGGTAFRTQDAQRAKEFRSLSADLEI